MLLPPPYFTFMMVAVSYALFARGIVPIHLHKQFNFYFISPKHFPPHHRLPWYLECSNCVSGLRRPPQYSDTLPIHRHAYVKLKNFPLYSFTNDRSRQLLLHVRGLGVFVFPVCSHCNMHFSVRQLQWMATTSM